MNNSTTYTPRLGEDITTCIENALEMSKVTFKPKGTNKKIIIDVIDVSFIHNGIEMTVNAANPVSLYLSLWHTKCKERSEAYKASPEYKEAKEKQLKIIEECKE